MLANWKMGLRLVRCEDCVATSLDDRLYRARARRRAMAAQILQHARAAAEEAKAAQMKEAQLCAAVE